MPPTTIYLPHPRISLDGQPNETLNADVQTVLVEETTEGLYRCEISFSNYGAKPSGGSGYLYLGRDVLDFGKEIAVELGPKDQARTVFKGRISGIEASYPAEGGGNALVLAEDRLQDLRMTRRTRVFEDSSDEDIIRQIASDHGLTPEIDVQGPTHKAVAQVNISDLAFIRERARSADVELWVEGTTLYAKSRPDRDGGTVDLEYRAALISFSVRADLAHQRTEVGVSGWDVSAKEAIEETADSSAISSELGNDTGGSSILEEAFAARKERVVHTVPFDAEEARGIAEARYKERARRFVTGTAMADGDARIRVGTTVNLSGLGGLFNGRYYVVRVRHTYSSLFGYRTQFDVERPGVGQPDS